jgi:hypothetical protein
MTKFSFYLKFVCMLTIVILNKMPCQAQACKYFGLGNADCGFQKKWSNGVLEWWSHYIGDFGMPIWDLTNWSNGLQVSGY